MSVQYLGVPFDVHSGGVDHIPVHHTNEIAQTRAATGLLLANWWLHGEFLNDKDRKMSKSSGGFITLQSLIDAGYSPLTYRFLTYQAHYRASLTFTEQAMAAAASALQHLHQLYAALPPDESAAVDADGMERFRSALRDDLNAPQALAVVWDVAKSTTIPPPSRRATLLAMNKVMPLGLEAVAAAPPADQPPPAEVLALLERRNAARQARNFGEADALRAQIGALGYDIRDSAQGSQLVRR
jgi:cysteinyl-tRNA synthetase